jgi:protease IV
MIVHFRRPWTALLACLVSLACSIPQPGYAQAVAEEKNKEAAAASPEKGEGEVAPKPSSIKVASIKLKGGLAEGNSAGSPFGGDLNSLNDILRRLGQAQRDKEIHAVILEIRELAVGRGKLNEIRSAIRTLRDSGKRVTASLEMATTPDYLVACACDQIIMPESGDLVLPGIRAELTFYKRLFEKFDITVDMLQVGDFKGAAEPYTRDSMSPAFRSQLEAVLGDYFEQMVEDIAAARGLPKERVKELIDQGMFTSADAKRVGLIDHIAYPSHFDEERICGCQHAKVTIVEDYAKKAVDTDFSGMTGFVKLLELMSGGKNTSATSKGKKIGLVYAMGAITSGKSASSFMGESTMGSDTIVEALREASEDENVSAIVFRIDSPGGSALASDIIWNEIQKIEKPVIASMGDVAGSGGYYIAMGCDKIYAEPGTLTGSIGVVGGKLALGKAMERFGLTTDVIAMGKNSGLFSANSPFTESERTAWQQMMNETYRLFTTKAAAGRKMTVDELQKLAGGRVWSGRQAKANGLIDEVGTLKDAIAEAQRRGGLEVKDNPELLILPEQKSFFEQLIEGDSVTTPTVLVPMLPTDVLDHLKLVEQLFSEPSVLLMPCKITIR